MSVALGEDDLIRSIAGDTDGVIAKTRIDRDAVGWKRNRIRTACAADPGIGGNRCTVPDRPVSELNICQPLDLAAVTPELKIGRERIAGRRNGQEKSVAVAREL